MAAARKGRADVEEAAPEVASEGFDEAELEDAFAEDEDGFEDADAEAFEEPDTEEEAGGDLAQEEVADPAALVVEADDDVEASGTVTPPPDATFDDEDDDAIVAAVTGDDEDDDEIEGLREGEFVCRACYMAKRDTQLADPERLICRDCA